jgi:hypothetical protein
MTTMSESTGTTAWLCAGGGAGCCCCSTWRSLAGARMVVCLLACFASEYAPPLRSLSSVWLLRMRMWLLLLDLPASS